MRTSRNLVWNRDTVMLEIARLHKQGVALNYGEMQRTHIRLLRAGMRYFGTWREAIEAAGINYEEVRRYQAWTDERIVEKIQEYHAKGLDLSWRHVSLELDPPLAAAAIRPGRFESWEAALKAAGLDYGDIRRNRSWTPDDILAEICRRHAEGRSMRVSDVTQEEPALVAASRRHFLGWYEAVSAAGLDELEARLGKATDLDRETAEGEISWAAMTAAKEQAAEKS